MNPAARIGIYGFIAPIVISLLSVFFLGIGLRGLLTRRPFLIPSRWLFGIMAVAFAPSIIHPLSWPAPGPVGGISMITWTSAVILIAVLVMMWVQLKGYTAYGVTDASFREGLHNALKALDIPFEETLSSVKLPSYSAELKVTMSGSMGSAQIQVKNSTDDLLLSKIVGEMNSYFRRTSVEANMATCLFHVILGVLTLCSAAGIFYTVHSLEKILLSHKAIIREKWQDLLDQKRYAEAMPYLEEAYHKHSDDFRYAEPMAFAYSSVSRYQDAITVLEALRTKQGKLSDYGMQLLAHAYLAPAYTYKNSHNWAKTLDAAKTAIRIRPDYAEAYEFAGLAAWEIQGPKSKEAHDYYARYLQLEPDPAKTTFIKSLYPDLYRKPN